MNYLQKKLFNIERRAKKKFLREKIYNNYHDALRACTKKGYENRAIIESVKTKGIAYRSKLGQQEYPALNIGVVSLLDIIHQVAPPPAGISVIDFGGADGIYYLQVRKCISPETKFRWHVVETPEMSAAMKDFETDELKFFSSIREAREKLGVSPLIFHTSGTLQYTPSPYDSLHEICESKAAYAVFNKQSLVNGSNDIVSIQKSLLSWHGDGPIAENFEDKIIKYPHTNIRKSEFELILKKHYKIIYTYEDSSGIKPVNKENIAGTCYVCKLQEV
jgi:putative methyltransferase (TIGR04325 family)